MKTIILMTALIMTTAFSRLASADVITLFSGYLSAVETTQFIDDKIVIDGTGNGNSTLGTFTYTYHFVVDPVTGKGKGTEEFNFANGDTWEISAIGLGDSTGVGAYADVTELDFINKATGQFAGVPGDLFVHRMVDQATGNTFGSFHGEFLKTE